MLTVTQARARSDMDFIKDLDRRIEELRSELESLESIRAGFKHKAAVAWARNMFDGKAPKKSRKETTFDKTEAAYSADSSWKTATELEAATGVGKNTIRQMLYVTHKDDFLRKKAKPPKKETLFLLKSKKESQSE